MNKEMISQNGKKPKILGDKKFISINERGVTCIKKKYRYLKINIQNSNGILTSIVHTFTKNNTHSKKYLGLDQFSKSNKKKSIQTETTYDEKELFQNKNKIKYNKARKSEYLKSKNITKKTKWINNKINNSYKSNKSNKTIIDNKIKKTPKNNKLIEEDSHTKINKLYLPRVLNNINIYKYYKRENLTKMPNSSRNYLSSASYKKINNDAIKVNETILRSHPHIRKINIKSIYKKNKNQIKNLRYKNIKTFNPKCINKDISLDIKNLFNAKNFYQNTDINQNLSFKLKAKIKDKKKIPLFNKKIRDIADFGNGLNHIKEENSKLLSLKNKGSKLIDFLDLIKMKKKKIGKNYMHNKSNKTNNTIRGYCSEDNSKIKYIRNKTNNNSIRNIDYIHIKRSFRSCDIPLKIKKIKNNKKRPLIKLINSDKDIKHKFPSINKEKSDIFNENKIKNKVKGLIQTGTYLEKESSYDILESEQELNHELINEIKINNFDVNKPKDQNMKYTLYKEFKEENENENESSKPESHVSKIIIGEIESYKDIIEKDRINCKNEFNIDKNKSELITVPVNDSIESEKYIINMINLDDNENNSSLFSNEFKNTISNEKAIKYNLKNTSFYPNIQYIKKTSKNNLNNKKGKKIKIEKNNENKSKDHLQKRYPKIIKKLNKKTKINDGNILSKSNNKINRKKNLNIPKIKRTIVSPLNKGKLTISKDSIGLNKNNLISKFMDENNKRDENCSIL